MKELKDIPAAEPALEVGAGWNPVKELKDTFFRWLEDDLDL